jgi:AcrR family transcriptional regulator
MTREHLLAAAAEVFARRGYHGATLDEVAQTAGFTTGAIYSNFSGKEELFLALATARERQLIDAFASAAQPGLTPAELVSSLRSVYAGASAEDRERNWQLWTEFTLHLMRDPDTRQQLVEQQNVGLGLVGDLIRRQSDESGIDPPLPVDLVARIFISLFTGLWHQQAIDPSGVDDDAFPTAVVFIAHALQALGTPQRRKGRSSARKIH